MDFESCYRFMQSRDVRYDGHFIVAVSSTGIYCRPSCPARTPMRRNVRFFASAAAAQEAGYRACKRCRPDDAARPPALGSDAAARALGLIADGVLDREGVSGLARRMHFSERHLHRMLRRELGAGPLALARAQRAQTARTLIESSALSFAEVARAAGFHSTRQFNETVRAVYAASPSELRHRSRSGPRRRGPGALELRLSARAPLATSETLAFLGRRAIPGLEHWEDGRYSRTLALAHGSAVVELAPGSADDVRCRLELRDLRDLTSAVARVRRMLDLDADPAAIDVLLGRDPLLAGNPGLRLPGTVAGEELALRAVLGQQVTLDAARLLAQRLLERHGRRLPEARGTLTHTFPTAGALAAADPGTLGLPRAPGKALRALAAAIAAGQRSGDVGAERAAVRAGLLAIPGIGPWTADYVTMRALGDPDCFLASDAGVRRALRGQRFDPERWRPWRSYAVIHLWKSLEPLEA
ncbi:MAG: AlkA N-terminal domain-containing protein [Solirubrobacteraceae bacterium]